MDQDKAIKIIKQWSGQDISKEQLNGLIFAMAMDADLAAYLEEECDSRIRRRNLEQGLAEYHRTA